MKFLQLNRARLFYSVILILGLGWIWFSANPQSATSGKIPAPQAGFLAPDFSLNTLTGENIKLSDLRGKVVLVNIWASWCLPCRAEMPALDRAFQKYKGQGFIVLAINSTIQDSNAKAAEFASTNKLSFPILLDEKGIATRLYRVQSLPSSFFIGTDGIVREVIIGGPMSEALLMSRIEKLLQEGH